MSAMTRFTEHHKEAGGQTVMQPYGVSETLAEVRRHLLSAKLEETQTGHPVPGRKNRSNLHQQEQRPECLLDEHVLPLDDIITRLGYAV